MAEISAFVELTISLLTASFNAVSFVLIASPKVE